MAFLMERPMGHLLTVYFIKTSVRSHKLLPLLEDWNVVVIEGITDLLRAKRPAGRKGIVLIDSFGRWALLGLIASVWLSSPLVVRLRGEFFREERLRRVYRYRYFAWLRYFFVTAVARLTLIRAKAVIYNSSYLKTKMPICNRKPTAVVYNPFTPIELSSQKNKAAITELKLQGRLRLLTVTNMGLIDKIQPTIDAIRAIQQDFWETHDVHWYVCGAGPMMSYFKENLRTDQLRTRVHLEGFVTNVAEYYKRCSVYIHMTNMDAFPNASLEAMYYKMPLIVNSDSCGTLEQVVEGENGQVISELGSLENVLREYIDDPERLDAHGRFGQRMVLERFSVQRQKSNMNSFLCKLSHTLGC